MPERTRSRTINGAIVMAEFAAERGIALRALLEGSGLHEAHFRVPSNVISFEQEFRLIRNLQRHCGAEPGLGLEIGSRYRFTTLAAVGFAVVSSANLRAAFDVVFRYGDLHPSLVRVMLEAPGREITMGFGDEELPEDIRQFAVERTTAVALSMSASLLGRAVIPRALHFRFPRPRRYQIYRHLAGVTPRFGTDRNLVVIAARDADEPLAQGNPVALHMAEEYCRHLLAARRARSGLAQQVRALIGKQPRQAPSMSEIARQFHLTPRSLHRKLRGEETSYQELCDEVRFALAEELLAMPRLPVDQVAERLGYSESAAFIRAFKRWSGLTPKAFRRSRC